MNVSLSPYNLFPESQTHLGVRCTLSSLPFMIPNLGVPSELA